MHTIQRHWFWGRAVTSWWRHQMETFSASPVPGEFPTQRSVTRNFDVFFDLCLNKRLNKQWWGWWFETLSRSLWRHRNVSTASDKEAILNNRCKRMSRVDYGRQYSPNKIKKKSSDSSQNSSCTNFTHGDIQSIYNSLVEARTGWLQFPEECFHRHP